MPARKTRRTNRGADRFNLWSHEHSPDADDHALQISTKSTYVDWDVTDTPPDGGDRWTTWDNPGIQHGPEPRPDWVITTGDAHDAELGVLKTGKEADVFLVERTSADATSLLAAKRYRSSDHKLFRRDDSYTAGRQHRKTRERRAMQRNTGFGRAVAAGMWAAAEWEALTTLWQAGVRVPYPVSHDHAEILMEFIDDGAGSAAPRLAQTRPSSSDLDSLWQQFSEVVVRLARQGLTHGDLSPYNLLVKPTATSEHGELVVIDLPQVVDVIGNPEGMTFLTRDVTNVATWFTSKGRPTDADDLIAEAVSHLY